MEGFKEFNGKDLDSVINEACAYFEIPREKLEIEIIQDAKSGIFGIVGARKAKIKARRAPVNETVQTLLGQKPLHHPDNSDVTINVNLNSTPDTLQEKKKKNKSPAIKEPKDTQTREITADSDIWPDDPDLTMEDDFIHSADLQDQEKLINMTREMIEKLVEPVAGKKIEVKVEIEKGRIRSHIDWTGDAGLIIGREGQTLEAFEYLASRMVSHGMQTPARIQIDIGEYRTRQEDKLKHTAKILAEKALHTGKSYSTRPLSSYHRRLIHLALQDMTEIMTRSSGEGPMKRVVISAKKSGKS